MQALWPNFFDIPGRDGCEELQGGLSLLWRKHSVQPVGHCISAGGAELASSVDFLPASRLVGLQPESVEPQNFPETSLPGLTPSCPLNPM